MEFYIVVNCLAVVSNYFVLIYQDILGKFLIFNISMPNFLKYKNGGIIVFIHSFIKD